MFGTNAISRIKETDPRVYLAVGVLSLLKALALRNHRRRSRRELRDAGLFLGLGLVLYQRGGEQPAEKADSSADEDTQESSETDDEPAESSDNSAES